jgi:hypothetical protein
MEGDKKEKESTELLGNHVVRNALEILLAVETLEYHNKN